jgi:serine phosphatase RsbU (regulator of sigma subunit)
LPELLCAAVDNYAAGAEQHDDMTVVAVRII